MHRLVDGLRAKGANAQGRHVMLAEGLLSIRHCHQHPQEGGPRLEDSDLVALDCGGESIGRRDRRALEDDGGDAREQRRGDH
eukprot:4046086-Prymnesium_polylepis.1